MAEGNGKEVKKRFQVTLTLLLLWLFIFSSAAYAANASETEDFRSSCDSNMGIGETFYNFEALNVIFPGFPSRDKENLPDFPNALKRDNFNARLLKALKQNFEKCLKNADGKNKPIIFYGAGLNYRPMIATLDSELVEAPPEFQEGIHDPKNLTLVIKIVYIPEQVWPKGEEKYRLALYSFYFYRAGVKYVGALMPGPQNSAMGLLYTHRGEDYLERGLDFYFRALIPKEVPTENPYSK